MKSLLFILVLLLSACTSSKPKPPPNPVEVYWNLPHADRAPCLPFDDPPWGTDRTQLYYQFRNTVHSDPLNIWFGVVYTGTPRLPSRVYEARYKEDYHEYLDGTPPSWRCLPKSLSPGYLKPLNPKELEQNLNYYRSIMDSYDRSRNGVPIKLPPNFNPFYDYLPNEEPVR